jgi:hypothetical protein
MTIDLTGSSPTNTPTRTMANPSHRTRAMVNPPHQTRTMVNPSHRTLMWTWMTTTTTPSLWTQATISSRTHQSYQTSSSHRLTACLPSTPAQRGSSATSTHTTLDCPQKMSRSTLCSSVHANTIGPPFNCQKSPVMRLPGLARTLTWITIRTKLSTTPGVYCAAREYRWATQRRLSTL